MEAKRNAALTFGLLVVLVLCTLKTPGMGLTHVVMQAAAGVTAYYFMKHFCDFLGSVFVGTKGANRETGDAAVGGSFGDRIQGESL
ncbi:hypothetical protein [Ralstonia pickettii]|uniref:Uncharacterized protein n=1 Tax=Ralstonia pickettii TaxID=329 RepID=A0AAW4Q990_RALPI|nr:hypothetical protein [Ralstonia pickettii]MBA9846755.1 hypothetical protein [Ralstonia pickettii]MBA9852093.1 hypothetical protein [Ralstonia pickettii]MBA9919892.1 hypothetical protein [Ralstonia pickettii]MBA9958994.1 hypothetical protein [Ralstonia pickettii]MBA9964627.1 hypothetical protein [Ralstonia pickettii]